MRIEVLIDSARIEIVKQFIKERFNYFQNADHFAYSDIREGYQCYSEIHGMIQFERSEVRLWIEIKELHSIRDYEVQKELVEFCFKENLAHQCWLVTLDKENLFLTRGEMTLENYPSFNYLERRGTNAGVFHAFYNFHRSLRKFWKVYETFVGSKRSEFSGFCDDLNAMHHYLLPNLIANYECFMKDVLWCFKWHASEEKITNYLGYIKELKRRKMKRIDIGKDYDTYRKRSVLDIYALMNTLGYFSDVSLGNVIEHSLLTELSTLIKDRHKITHESWLSFGVDSEEFDRFIFLIGKIVQDYYVALCRQHGWPESVEF